MPHYALNGSAQLCDNEYRPFKSRRLVVVISVVPIAIICVAVYNFFAFLPSFLEFGVAL
jgi:hypothetical protein